MGRLGCITYVYGTNPHFPRSYGLSERIPLPADAVKDFITACHARPNVVSDLLNDEPQLVRASTDWGEGNWENGLEAAGHMGNREIAELLLSRGVTHTIFSAAMLGERKLVESNPVSPDAASTPGVHGISLIYHVAISGDTDMADIVQSTTDAPGKDEALHPAVKFAHIDMVAWLIENGAQNLSVHNFQNRTPLYVALESDQSDIVSLLRQYGAK